MEDYSNEKTDSITYFDKLTFQVLKKKLSQTKKINLRIITDSMSPLVQIGDIIEVIKTPALLQRFDIVVFYHDDKLICHYVWHKNISKFSGSLPLITTRSMKDCTTSDFPINDDNILGIVKNKKISFLTRLKITIINLFKKTS